MNRFGIEQLSVFGMPPVDYVHLAADLGCGNISAALFSHGYNPHGYPAWSLKDDAPLRRDMIAAMRERGVRISLAEGFSVRPGDDVAARAADMDLMAELGAVRINMVSLDPDLPRTFDAFATLAEMAAARGLQSTTEFAPGLAVKDLPTAIRIHDHVGRDDFRLLIDMMHFGRSGAAVADLAALGGDRIGYVQLSDAPMAPRFDTYMEEAMYERMVPGTGEMPIAAVLALVPDHVTVSVEVPRRSLAEAGVGPAERIAPCVAAAKKLVQAATTGRG